MKLSEMPFRFFKPGIIAVVIFLSGCVNTTTADVKSAAPELSVYTVVVTPATIYQEFPAALEGKNNVEIRPQVDGYLDKIYVEEGAYVKADQPLFQIDSRVYGEQVNMAQANLEAADANIQKAKVEVDRQEALVAGKVVSDVQLQTAKANYAAAIAAATQAKAAIAGARINAGFTNITAPLSGYIGRIHYRKGSLLSKSDPAPITLLSDIQEIYAYFSLSEADFIAFQHRYPGADIEEKLKAMPPLELLMADNSIYPEKGRMNMVDGQFDKTTGAISVRAVFPNPHNMLRTGNTGRIRMPQQLANALAIPQAAIFNIQDKSYVYVVGADNKVSSHVVKFSGKTENAYFIAEGLKAGDKIVLTGIGNLKDGDIIKPQIVTAASVFKTTSSDNLLSSNDQ